MAWGLIIETECAHYRNCPVIWLLTSKYRAKWSLQMILVKSWWRHQMETFSASLDIYAGNSPVTGEFPAQRPVTRSFDVFFDLRLNNGWVNNHEAGDLRRHRAHYDVTVMVPDVPAHVYRRLPIRGYCHNRTCLTMTRQWTGCPSQKTGRIFRGLENYMF